ncbi:hypothetical protein [Halobellus ordinarius]|nr:hypothetical protein [Halobellus sp. ZY16]
MAADEIRINPRPIALGVLARYGRETLSADPESGSGSRKLQRVRSSRG